MTIPIVWDRLASDFRKICPLDYCSNSFQGPKFYDDCFRSEDMEEDVKNAFTPWIGQRGVDTSTYWSVSPELAH